MCSTGRTSESSAPRAGLSRRRCDQGLRALSHFRRDRPERGLFPALGVSPHRRRRTPGPRKRAKDRVILKLVGLHGLLYSEEEADEFKSSTASVAASEAASQGREEQPQG